MLATLAPDIRIRPVSAQSARELTARFTLNGDNVLEQQLALTCNKVRAGINRIIPARRLQAIALGGGYGRGEGGVLGTNSGDQPYNDLEFYIFVNGIPWINEQRFGTALHKLSAELTAFAGVEVEFKITSLASLRRSSASMFYYDLVMGHRWLSGDDDLLGGCEHHRNPALLPPSEATRLLMNRFSGLLLAREKLEHEHFTNDDADFVFRNLAKAQLALGDAVLTVFGQYHWSCPERHRRLWNLSLPEEFPGIAAVRTHHATGVEFKLHPHRSALSRDVLQTMHYDLSALALNVWLWLESRRLQCRFETARDYGLSRINKWPGTSSWRNWITNVKVFGPAALAQPRIPRHPRDGVLNALTLLLWADAKRSGELEPILRRELRATGATALITAYQGRWSRVS